MQRWIRSGITACNKRLLSCCLSSAATVPRVGVSVIAVDNHAEPRRYLLVQRGRPPAQFTWSFPGGKVEAGEPVLQAGARELWEETGLGPAHCKFIATPVTCTDAIGPDYHFVISQMLCFVDTQTKPTVAASDDAIDVAWLTADEILANSRTYTPKLTDVIVFIERLLANNVFSMHEATVVPITSAAQEQHR